MSYAKETKSKFDFNNDNFILHGVLGGGMVLSNTLDKRFILLGLFVMLVLVGFTMIPGIYDIVAGRKVPLMKRAAVVAQKRIEEGDGHRKFYVAFAFPDNSCLEYYRGRRDRHDLEEGDHIVIKYRRLGEFEQRLVFYGYERLEKQPKE